MNRFLTGQGGEQALARRRKLGEPRYDSVISSPAKRAVQTALIAGGMPPNILEMPELCWEPGTDTYLKMDELFKELGYAPLTAYREKGGAIYDEHGESAWAALQSQVPATDAKILLVGHAVFINALGCAVAKKYDETLACVSFGECEGFTLYLRDGVAQALTLHRG
jgi:broad specificity phosphatase PhoE